MADAVGDEPGPGGRKGDVVVTSRAPPAPAAAGSCSRSRTAGSASPSSSAELDAARQQRDAEYAVLVVPGEDEVPASLHALREYHGDKLIAVYDPEEGSTLELEFAYRVARARVAMSADAGEEIDAAAVMASVGRARDAVDDVRKVKHQLTTAENSIGNAKELVDALAATCGPPGRDRRAARRPSTARPGCDTDR